MKEFILTLVGVCFASSLVLLFSPWLERYQNMQKSLRYVVSLCLIATLASPLLVSIEALRELDVATLIKSFDFGSSDACGKEELEDDFAETLEKYGAEYINAAVGDDIRNKFKIDADECRAVVSLEYSREGKLCIKKITVILSGHAVWRDPHEIEEYTEGRYGGECAVAID